jgi:hypothetical protein
MDGLNIFFVIVATVAGLALIASIGIYLYARKHKVGIKQAIDMLQSEFSKLFKRNASPSTISQNSSSPFHTPHPPTTPYPFHTQNSSSPFHTPHPPPYPKPSGFEPRPPTAPYPYFIPHPPKTPPPLPPRPPTAPYPGTQDGTPNGTLNVDL